LRIFPPYYFYLLISTSIIVFCGARIKYEDSFKQLPWAITYTYNFFHASSAFHANTLITHFWSLAVEEQFYIFFPLLIFFMAPKSMKRIFLWIIISGPIIRLLLYLIVNHQTSELINPNEDIVIYVLPFSHIDAFITGGFFSVYLKKYKPKTSFILVCFFSILIIGVVTSKISIHSFQFNSMGYSPFMKDSYKYIWGYSLFSIFFSILLLRLNHRDFCKYIFENNLLNYLGKISYGLYIYHFSILGLVKDNIGKFISYNSCPLIMKISLVSSISLLITIIFSIISFELFEKFFLKLKTRFFPN